MNKHFLTQEQRTEITARYQALEQRFPKALEAAGKKMALETEEVTLALQYLYVNMPYSDIGNVSVDMYLDFARHGVFLWKSRREVQSLPKDLFLSYVLYHRVNEEEIAPCRSLFYQELAEPLRGLSFREAAREVNYWCAKEAAYQAGDERTLSALSVYRRGCGRCGEESVFLVNALRSVGIPARQIYAPRWSHCDDNHAWVELWLDGEWHFTGACEPLEIFNKGWFTNASSRAMMIHSRLFGSQGPRADVIGREGMVTMQNELSRYAAVKRIQVQVVNEEGLPAAGAEIAFEVLNGSEFYPIARMVTDEEGRAELTTGLGSLRVYGSSGGSFAWTDLDVRQKHTCKLCLGKQPQAPEEAWYAIDFIAPKDTPIHTEMLTKEQEKKGKRRLADAAKFRLRKMRGWRHPDREAFLAAEDHREWREAMLGVLSEKDQTDLRRQVLEEHLQYALPYADSFPKEIFVPYVLNPRVEYEILSAWRKGLEESFSEEEKEQFREMPARIWEEVDRLVEEHPEGERESLITVPLACLSLGTGSLRSKKVLFVAIARTLGIPARLRQEDGAVEYWQGDGFVPVLSEAKQSAKLILYSQDTSIYWRYFQNFSVARMERGQYVSLRLSNREWSHGELTVELTPGRYRILTSNRLPNGNQFAYQYELELISGEEKKLSLPMRKAELSDMLETIAIPEFYLRDAKGQEIPASDLTRQGRRVMLWLSESEEPTEHLLNELLEQKEAFLKYQKSLLFIVRSGDAFLQPAMARLQKAFPEVETCYDSMTENTNMLGRRMYVDHERLPLVVVTDGTLQGIYAASGYNVGIGAMLLRLLKMP